MKRLIFLACIWLLQALQPVQAQSWPTPRSIEERALISGWVWARHLHADTLITGVRLLATRAYITERDEYTDGFVAAIPPNVGSWGSFALIDHYDPVVNLRSWVTLMEITLEDGMLPDNVPHFRKYTLAIPAVSVPQIITSPD